MRLPFALCAAFLAAMPVLAQPVAPAASEVSAAPAALTISYSGKTIAFTADDLTHAAHQDVTAYDFHEKANHVYAGIPVRDLLAKAGVAFGEKLRGKGLRQVVIVHCQDGYAIAFALAEFDADFNPRTILLSDTQDGQPTSAGQGPLRLVVPGDKRPARWARQVVSFEVTTVGN